MCRRSLLLLAAFLAAFLAASGAASGATLRGAVEDGTGFGIRGEAPVRLVCMSGGEWVAGDGRSGFRFDGLPEGAENPFILHAEYLGVLYRLPLVLGAGADTTAAIAVYDTTRSGEALVVAELEIRLVREEGRLRIDQIYRVENRSDPPRTAIDPGRGVFAARLPLPAAEANDLSVAASDGVVPERLDPLPGAEADEVRVDHAFRPGFNAVAVTYDALYPGSFDFRIFVPYPIGRLLLVAPAGAEVEGAGLERAHMGGRGPAVWFREELAPGGEIRFTIQGGEAAPEEAGGDVGLGPFPFEERAPLIVVLAAAVLLGTLAAALLRPGRGR
ncbi:MAG: hypothetical protein JW958_01160 [Candidatus Eisenbacteria bacterium]|nr:hypothetical protein [Candidatus Eisenbacteria bacterium]